MLSYRTKSISWMIVIWFALLQAISPFIHGHIEADHPSKGVGLHLPVDELDVAAMDSVPTLKNAVDPMHVVVVDKAIVKNTKWLDLPLLCLFALVVWGFYKPVLGWLVRTCSVFHLLFLRSSARPRAPPGF